MVPSVGLFFDVDLGLANRCFPAYTPKLSRMIHEGRLKVHTSRVYGYQWYLSTHHCLERYQITLPTPLFPLAIPPGKAWRFLPYGSFGKSSDFFYVQQAKNLHVFFVCGLKNWKISDSHIMFLIVWFQDGSYLAEFLLDKGYQVSSTHKTVYKSFVLWKQANFIILSRHHTKKLWSCDMLVCIADPSFLRVEVMMSSKTPILCLVWHKLGFMVFEGSRIRVFSRSPMDIHGYPPRGGGGGCSAGFCITLLGRHRDTLTLCSTHFKPNTTVHFESLEPHVFLNNSKSTHGRLPKPLVMCFSSTVWHFNFFDLLSTLTYLDPSVTEGIISLV